MNLVNLMNQNNDEVPCDIAGMVALSSGSSNSPADAPSLHMTMKTIMINLDTWLFSATALPCDITSDAASTLSSKFSPPSDDNKTDDKLKIRKIKGQPTLYIRHACCGIKSL